MILESFDSPVPYTWERRGGSLWTALFTAGDVPYRADFMIDPVELSAEFAFAPDQRRVSKELARTIKKVGSTGRLGTNTAREVFSTVRELITRFLNTYEPQKLSFVGSRPRSTLYRKLLMLLAKRNRRYQSVVERIPGVGDRFVLARRAGVQMPVDIAGRLIAASRRPLVVLDRLDETLALTSGVIIPPGNLGVPREKMPQIRSFHVAAFLKWLKKEKGISSRKIQFPANKIKGTQREINPKRIEMVLANLDLKRLKKPVLLASDDYLLDGHHRWAALYNYNRTERVPAWRINLPIRELLEIAKEFPEVQYQGHAMECLGMTRTPLMAIGGSD